MIWLDPEFRRCLPEGAIPMDYLFSLQGEIYRQQPGRCTLRFECDGRGYFLKAHDGVGWREIFKNLFSMRLPVVGARNEWRAIRRLDALGVDTMRLVGYGREGMNPARQRSFVVTEELANTISLEDFCRDWPSSPPPLAVKRALLDRVADMARELHENGINHRDFYICHFLLDRSGDFGSGDLHDFRLHLIDLHRVQIRRRTPRRWLVKDIGGLYFSALDIGLNRNDVLRFMRRYRGKSLRELLQDERRFWIDVQARAVALYGKAFDREPTLPIR